MTDPEIDHEAVWRILHEECGARAEMDPSFTHLWPDCREFRFMGALGFGGKVWFERGFSLPSRVSVSCYSEDETPERRVMVERANERLAALRVGAR